MVFGYEVVSRTRRMKKYYSISQYPGKTGSYFYNLFFKKYNIDASYVALGCQPEDFPTLFAQLTNDTDTHGISVSMPYKKAVMDYCSNSDRDAVYYDSCNTITLNDTQSTGHNCDLNGVIEMSKLFSVNDTVSILGDGAMGQMFYRYLKDNKYQHINLYSRNKDNWQLRHDDADVVINCTSLGTSIPNSPLEQIPTNCKMIIDLAIKDNELAAQSKQCAIRYIGGMTFYGYQFIKQFEYYSGIKITIEQFNEAMTNELN
jgi:shikimate 5-dehydrogenase